MIVSAGGNTDTVAVILPEASDSTIESLERVTPPVSGLTFDLFGRAGKIASGVAASPLTVTDSGGECASWPLARLQRQHANWQVGFVSGRGASGKFDVGYYNRTAGAEESTKATEILTAIRIGSDRRPAIVVSIEYDEGGKLGLIERTAPGKWRATWTSAYTDC